MPEPIELSSPVWTLPEAAKFLNVPTYAVRVLVHRGKLRYQRIGKRFVVPKADVLSLLETGWKRQGTPDRKRAGGI
jgi:excisionase family DNA binding protein